jgi:thiamine-monophosphate kinase
MPLPERALIAELRQIAGKSSKRLAHGSKRAVLKGIGDDCAVLRIPSRCEALVTTDFSLEGIHFRREWHPPESVGHRCLTRGLSDIAAMGGQPIAIFLSLALAGDVPQSWVRSFVRGMVALAEKHGATVAGGDTAASPCGILADIIVLGAVPKGKAVLRSGARPGDRIFVSGQLGGSAAALRELMARPKKRLRAQDYPRHFYPEARVELGKLLREQGLASAMIDTSDGLSTDLSHLCAESGFGATLDAAMVPLARVGKPLRNVDIDLALHGGEDYELLFTARPGARIPKQVKGVPLTPIGEITRRRGILLTDLDGRVGKLRSLGWEHFGKK